MNILEKEFVPYEQALALKELGFDEPCFATYQKGLKGPIMWDYWSIKLINSTNEEDEVECTAPTFSQVFRWLLKNHNLYGIIIPTITMNWTFKTMTVVEDIMEVPPYKHVDANDFNTYEEAELACLIKLIEIVKNK